MEHAYIITNCACHARDALDTRVSLLSGRVTDVTPGAREDHN